MMTTTETQPRTWKQVSKHPAVDYVKKYAKMASNGDLPTHWIYLKNGWCAASDPVSSIHEGNGRSVSEAINDVFPVRKCRNECCSKGFHFKEDFNSTFENTFAKKLDWIIWEGYGKHRDRHSTIQPVWILTDGDGEYFAIDGANEEPREFTSPQDVLDFINNQPDSSAKVYSVDMKGRVRQMRLGYINQFMPLHRNSLV